MQIGIIGYKGFVGSAFFEVFSKDAKCEVTGIEKGNLEACKGMQFDLLINANGNSSKRLADTDPMKDFEANVLSSADFLHSFKYAHYVHISTIEVYNSRTDARLTSEDAPINPQELSNYGFSKYLGELVVKTHAKSWLIVRLAGMVGANMKKGPAFDILNLRKLFISERSKFLFMNTKTVAQTVKKLVEKGKWNEIYNVAGKGNIELSEFAKIAKISLVQTGKDVQCFDINVSKLEKEMHVPTSREAIEEFIKTSQ